jgi:hypothetical protein
MTARQHPKIDQSILRSFGLTRGQGPYMTPTYTPDFLLLVVTGDDFLDNTASKKVFDRAFMFKIA